MDRRTIDLEGVPVRYYESGGGPALVLLHGAGGTARLWRRQIGPLSTRFRVLVPDLPGFGGSGLPARLRSVRGYGAFAAEFLKALRIGRASVAGSSMGGWAACWFALDYPEMLDSLVLISPAGLYDEEAPPMPVGLIMEEIGRYYEAAAAEERIGAGPLEEYKKAVDTLTVIDRAGGFTPDLEGRLQGIIAETTIVWGTGDKVIPVSYAEVFHKAIRGSRLCLIEGAGHLPFMEKPDEVNDILLNIS